MYIAIRTGLKVRLHAAMGAIYIPLFYSIFQGIHIRCCKSLILFKFFPWVCVSRKRKMVKLMATYTVRPAKETPGGYRCLSDCDQVKPVSHAPVICGASHQI